MSLKKNYFLKFTIISLLFLTIVIIPQSVLFLKNPPVWPDEAILTDISYNWLSAHRLGTNLWLDAYMKANDHWYSYPPLYFYTQAVWLKSFGLSIENMRLLSLFFTLGFAITFFFLIKQFLKQKPKVKSKINSNLLALITLAALLIDPFFFQATHFARVEIVVMFLGTLGFYLFTKSIQISSSKKRSMILMPSAGLIFGLAFLTHFIGAFFALSAFISLLINEKFSVLKSRNFYLLFLFFLTLPVIWLTSLINNLEVFKNQILLFGNTVSGYPPYIFNLILGEPLMQLLLIIYILTTVIFVAYIFTIKSSHYLSLCSLLIIAWFSVIFGKEMWYFVYVLPWIYLSAGILINNLFNNANKSQFQITLLQLVIILFAANCIVNIFMISNTIKDLGGDKYSYQIFIADILKLIPKEQSIFLSVIPDPYFGLKSSPNNYTIYEFPVVKISAEKYLIILNSSDYIVYNGIHNAIAAPGLQEYIQLNTQEIFNIGGKNQYQTQVIKLKPRNQRQIANPK